MAHGTLGCIDLDIDRVGVTAEIVARLKQGDLGKARQSMGD